MEFFNITKKCAIFAVFFCFSQSMIFPMEGGDSFGGGSPPRERPKEDSEEKTSPSRKKRVREAGILSPDDHKRTPERTPKRTPAVALTPNPPTLVTGLVARRLFGPDESLLTRDRDSAASSSVGVVDSYFLPTVFVNRVFPVIESLQRVFFDLRTTYDEGSRDGCIGDLTGLIKECIDTDALAVAVPFYIHLMDFCRSLLYGRKMDVARYAVRVESRLMLIPLTEKLFGFINSQITSLVDSGLFLSPIEHDRLRQAYRAAVHMKEFLLLGRSLEDFKFTVYAGCFVDFLKLIKRIENFFRSQGVVRGDVFESVVAVCDEHIGFVGVNDSGSLTGGHRHHLNNYSLLCPGSPSRAIVVGSPREDFTDDSGVTAVEWTADSGKTKASTLFPRCYNRMFLVYLQQLCFTVEARLSSTSTLPDFHVVDIDRASGRAYVEHPHKANLGTVADFNVCTCGLVEKLCPVFGESAASRRPLMVACGWNDDPIDSTNPSVASAVNAANYVRVYSTAFPVINTLWSDRSPDVLSQQNINLLDAMKAWLGTEDARRMFWHNQVERIRDAAISDMRDTLAAYEADCTNLESVDVRGAIVYFAKLPPVVVGQVRAGNITDAVRDRCFKTINIRKYAFIRRDIIDPLTTENFEAFIKENFSDDAMVASLMEYTALNNKLIRFLTRGGALSTAPGAVGSGPLVQWDPTYDHFEVAPEFSLETFAFGGSCVGNFGDFCRQMLLNKAEEKMKNRLPGGSASSSSASSSSASSSSASSSSASGGAVDHRLSTGVHCSVMVLRGGSRLISWDGSPVAVIIPEDVLRGFLRQLR